MSMIELKQETELGLFCKNGKDVLVSSRKIAELFEKEHKNIINMIELRFENVKNLSETEKQFVLSNFKEEYYKVRGKSYKEYLISKNGFIYVVMGLEGDKAEEIKIAYINAFDNMYNLINTRQFAKLHYKPMTDAIKDFYDRNEKDIKPFSYSNEADMINKIALGYRAKEYRVVNNIPEDMETRDYIPKDKLEIIDKLEITNTELLNLDLEYNERKILLTKRYKNILNIYEIA